MSRASAYRWLEAFGIALTFIFWFFFRKNVYAVSVMLALTIAAAAYMTWCTVGAARQHDARQDVVFHMVATAVLVGFAALLGSRLIGLL